MENDVDIAYFEILVQRLEPSTCVFKLRIISLFALYVVLMILF